LTRMRPLLAVAFVLLAPSAHAWGPVAHQAISSEAIGVLPGPLKDFYKSHRAELPSLALEPTFPEETLDRRFAVDRLLAFPFLDLPKAEAAVVARYGASPGRLPWLIQESYGRLVEAFKAKDKERILAESDLLAGLVADLENPLALTDNADGQKTEQHGLWIRFGTRLPEAMERRLKLSPEAARFLDDPKGYVFSIIAGSYVWIDNLLYEEELARRGQGGYNDLYYAAFERRVGPIARARLSQAATDVGSYWYTAWTNAQRPELK
jgi:hypothetical protein